MEITNGLVNHFFINLSKFLFPILTHYFNNDIFITLKRRKQRHPLLARLIKYWLANATSYGLRMLTGALCIRFYSKGVDTYRRQSLCR